MSDFLWGVILGVVIVFFLLCLFGALTDTGSDVYDSSNRGSWGNFKK